MNPPPSIFKVTTLLMRPSRPSRYMRTSRVSRSPHMFTSVNFPRISYSCSRPSLYPLTTYTERPGVIRWANSLETMSVHTAKTLVFVVILVTKALAQGLLIPATPAKVNISQKGKRARGRINLGNRSPTRARNPKPLISPKLAKKTGTMCQTAAISLHPPINPWESHLARLNLVQWLYSEGGRKRLGVQVTMKMRTVYLLYLRSLPFQDPRVRSHSNVAQHHHHRRDLVFLP